MLLGNFSIAWFPFLKAAENRTILTPLKDVFPHGDPRMCAKFSDHLLHAITKTFCPFEVLLVFIIFHSVSPKKNKKKQTEMMSPLRVFPRKY